MITCIVLLAVAGASVPAALAGLWAAAIAVEHSRVEGV